MVFSYVVKRIKFKITAQFRASRGLRVEDTKSIITPEMRPKSFETFEKWAPAPLCGLDFAHVQSYLTQAYVGKKRQRFWPCSVDVIKMVYPTFAKAGF